MFRWSNQVILLTGGTGSFGQAFTKYILQKYYPKIIRIYSRDEFKQYQMQQKINSNKVRYFIGDIRDKERLKRAMEDVTLVIHAAAMKQILACEYNPTEAIQTNIIGGMNILNTAIDAGVKRIMGLITDKAVSPTNLYGATKLCLEKLLIQANSYSGKGKTIISCVRYGNVTGSRGSVIPLFIKQKEKGEKITVTHPEATRFWITLEGGVKFVIKIIELMKGGEIFIPKMPSIKVTDLAKAIASENKIIYTGLRPGEKLHEDLISIHESRNTYENKSYFVIKPDYIFWKKIKNKLFRFKKVTDNFYYNSKINSNYLTINEIRSKLQKLIRLRNI